MRSRVRFPVKPYFFAECMVRKVTKCQNSNGLPYWTSLSPHVRESVWHGSPCPLACGYQK